jgi:hypothetical protein
VTSDETLLKCKDACKDCNTCLKANLFQIDSSLQQCHRECDRCKYCQFQEHNYDQTYDPPYWNRYPELPNPILYGDVLYSEMGSKDQLAIGKLEYAPSKFTTSNVCGPVMYQEYIDRYNDYKQCKMCAKYSLCWSKERQDCVQCEPQQLLRTCETRFGCSGNTPNNIDGYVPPKDPLYTACIPCWK